MASCPLYTSSFNDYRSDTFTIPTDDICAQMAKASKGDSIYNEDADTYMLEKRIADEFVKNLYGGKEPKGLFCVSTTMSNQLGIRVHLNMAPPFSVLCDRRAHVFVDECAGISMFSQALVIPVQASNEHYLTLDDIKGSYFPDDGNIHLAPTKVISLENTLHGMCYPYDELKRISDWAHGEGILLHLDGARLWNAVAASNECNKIDYMHKVCSLFDSISLCLSKSLGAPIGSVLIGDSDFIKKAKHLQKQQGGGIRQAGFITRAANYCIDINFPDALVKVNRVTKIFWADLYRDIKDMGLELKLMHPVETNFIFIDLEKSKINFDLFLEISKKNNIKVFDGRLAFHYQNIGEGLKLLKQTFIDIALYYQTHDYSPGTKSVRFY